MSKIALISVYDKSGIDDLGSFLDGSGWDLVSTGGTSEYLKKLHIPVIDVSSITGFPECLNGRVKTLHASVFAGILACRNNPSHMDTLEKMAMDTIDLVCVNLYPFFEKVREGLDLSEMVEFIDIGGPSMLRSAAKNFRDVIVLCDPSDYDETITFINAGAVPMAFKKYLAGKAFNLVSAYDAAVARYLLDSDTAIGGEKEYRFPNYWPLSQKKDKVLRYGENSHQTAALYLAADNCGALGGMEQLNGKDPGYNNIRDLDLAWKAVCAFGLPPAPQSTTDAQNPLHCPGAIQHCLPFGEEELIKLGVIRSAGESPVLPACVAVKHNTPCGAAAGFSLLEAFDKTYACDPESIYGGIVACNVSVDAATAEKLSKLFLEILVAPDFDSDALLILKKKKNIRVIKADFPPVSGTECVSVDGGLLVQQTDKKLVEHWETATDTLPGEEDIADLIFALRTVSFVKSNAIVVAKNLSAMGIGGGQTSRIRAAKDALLRSADSILNARDNPSLSGLPVADGKPARVMASDAFFPFADVVEAAAAAGIKAIVQPGGSLRDKESIEACNKYGIAMILTGTRHFKH